MKIAKSSRHSKITGDFAERLVLYWLSKYGFECMHVDHVGMDIVAKNPHTNELMGISVKSRSKNEGTEGSPINIPNKNIRLLEQVCSKFTCVPYFAIVVDREKTITVYILSKKHLVHIFKPGKSVVSWKMSKDARTTYEADSEIMIFEFSTDTKNWWKTDKRH